ncbi:MAG: VWA domain-containing protein [Acidobacteriota bacterium]
MRPRTLTCIFQVLCLLAIGQLALWTQPAHAADGPTCADIPLTTSQDGRDFVLDECYTHQFDYAGDTYTVSVFYTEDPTIQDEVGGVTQCEADELQDCEHALEVLDSDGDGNNDYAVQVAEQIEIMVPYYLNRSLPVIENTTDFYVQIAEETGNGFILVPNGLQLDDDYVETTNILKVRGNAFHEGQHLVQDKFNTTIGWQTWFTEGIARTAQDRTDADYDALTSSNYLNQFDNVLVNSTGVREKDILTIKYDATTWWTWFMDQYAAPGESEPGIGWEAIRDFYDEVEAETNHSLDALEDYVAAQGSTFEEDFIDYTLALYAYEYNPADPRLAFLDAEVNSQTDGLKNYDQVGGAFAFTEENVVVQPRSSVYYEHNPGGQCDFVAFTFKNNAATQAFSVMTVDSAGTLVDRWTTRSSEWTRTVNADGLDRVVGVITGLDGPADDEMTIGRGCVTPELQIKRPTTNALAYVGEADNPRQFLVRLGVTGKNGSGVAGFTKDDFTVQISDGGTSIEANVVNALYVQDDYWLLVQAPHQQEGAETGQFYDLSVELTSSISDTQPLAVLYVERTLDKLIVLDRSGSMADGGRLEAAQNAAVLMTYELDESDQGAYVPYSDDAVVEEPLALMQPGQLFNMAAAIQSTTASGSTSIGDGLLAAADEEDALGLADHACVLVLLSDGYENEPELWADVEDQVTDNECFMEVVGLGPTANEALLQQIAASSLGGGFYDFAPVSGGVPIDSSIQSGEELSWENYLSRVFDMKATRAAGRQRMMSDLGSESTGVFPFAVDPTTDELVVSIAWQQPSNTHFISLFDPSGVPLPPAGHQSIASSNTAEVWRETAPQPGQWTLLVTGLAQQYHVSASGRTLLELHLFTGQPGQDPLQGVKVPILANLAGLGKPITGASVTATITSPAGVQKQVTLFDDGTHIDMEANDGVYGNWYTQTSGGETVVADPGGVVEGEEPVSRGSYLVSAVAQWSGLRREAEASFLLREADDDDGDGFPTWWEKENGLDPNDPTDPLDDPDGDGLPNRCEWTEGTDPQNPDTDGGGESDGSEIPNCIPGTQDPLDPRDDRVGPVKGMVAIPRADVDGTPIIHLELAGLPDETLQDVDIYFRLAEDPSAEWELLAADLPPAPDWSQPVAGLGKLPAAAEFRIVPTFVTASEAIATGHVMDSGTVILSSDPYPPQGSVVIVQAPDTFSTRVDLLIEASDTSHLHGADDDRQALPEGTPPGRLLMRLSTDPAFAGVSWQPFQAEVRDFDLGSLQPGEFVTVYVQFMDEASNISDDVAGDTSDTTRYLPAQIAATIDYSYRMASGDAASGQFSLLDDGSFVDSSTETGRWFFQTVPATRFILLYDTGFACNAAMVGELTPPDSLRGPRLCRDGSGDSGSWVGTLLATDDPDGDLGEFN